MGMRQIKPLKPLVDHLKGFPANPGAKQRIFVSLGIPNTTNLSEVIKMVAIELENGNQNFKPTDLALLAQGLNKKKYNLG